MDVSAGAEIFARAANDDAFDGVGVNQVAERIAKFGIGFERERILAVGPIERDGRLVVD